MSARVLQVAVGGFDNNFSYIITGSNTHAHEAILVDATGSKEVIEKILKENNLTPIAQLLTHSHFDHKEQVAYFEKKGVPLMTFAEIEKLKKKAADTTATLTLCGTPITILFTPGHHPESVCFIVEDTIITGDTLFVRGIGATHFDGGNAPTLHKSLTFLADIDKQYNHKLTLYPGHNYGGASSSLKEALANSSILPSKKVLNDIEKKRKVYEKSNLKK